MPFRYLHGSLVSLVIKRSLDQFAGVGSSLGHKNDMFCLPGVGFFLAKFPLSSDLIIRVGSNAFNNLEGA